MVIEVLLTRKILESVMFGSEMTRSPVFGSLITRSLVWRYCSAMRGEIFALKAPVPNPRVMTPRMNGTMAFPLVKTAGIAEMISKIWPRIEKAMAINIVLKRPRYSSAMIAPLKSVTFQDEGIDTYR